MYFQSSPIVQQVMEYADGPHGVFMVPTDGDTMMPKDFEAVQDILNSWRHEATDDEIDDPRFTLLSKDMSADQTSVTANQAATDGRDRYSTSIIRTLSTIHSLSFDQ